MAQSFPWCLTRHGRSQEVPLRRQWLRFVCSLRGCVGSSAQKGAVKGLFRTRPSRARALGKEEKRLVEIINCVAQRCLQKILFGF